MYKLQLLNQRGEIVSSIPISDKAANEVFLVNGSNEGTWELKEVKTKAQLITEFAHCHKVSEDHINNFLSDLEEV